MGKAYVDTLDNFLECVGHTTTNNHFIYNIQEVVDDLDLVAYFGATKSNVQKKIKICVAAGKRLNLPSEDGKERALRLAEDFREVLKLLLDEEARSPNELDADH